MKKRCPLSKMALFGVFALSLSLPSCVSIAALQGQEHRLSPPFDAAAIRARSGQPDTKTFSCGTPPEPLRDLQFESIYGNLSSNNSIIDPSAYDAYSEKTAPLGRYQNGLTSMANRYLKSAPHNPEIAVCTLKWLEAWAEEGALLGDVNRTGAFVRKWVLSSIALSYIQIRDEPMLDPWSDQKVRSWILEVSNAVIADFSRDTDKESRQNNHLYWAAWAVASAAVALDDPSMFRWAMKQAKFGMSQIEKDGTLALELKRGRMALNYHVFAASPLIMLAEIGARNGVDLYAENDGALKRFARRVIGGLDNPAYFEKLTHEKQDVSRILSATNLVWLEPYNARYPDTQADKWLKKLQPLRNSRVGGNATLLYGRHHRSD